MIDSPYLAPDLYDETVSEDGNDIYKYDCHNLPICEKYYGNVPLFACLRGANSGSRCTHGEKNDYADSSCASCKELSRACTIDLSTSARMEVASETVTLLVDRTLRICEAIFLFLDSAARVVAAFSTTFDSLTFKFDISFRQGSS